MKLIDSHCHLDFDVFDKDRNEVIQNASRNGVQHIVIPGVDRNNWGKIQQVCESYGNISACFGLHPYYVDTHKPDDVDALADQLTSCNSVALGECGLDYRQGQADKKTQQYYFEAQLELAKHAHKPVVIHSVKATEQVINTLKKFPELRGMVHSYSGSYEQAKQLNDMGYFLSFGGSVTYDRASKLRKMFKQVPLEFMLLETDSPDQADASHHQQRNEPAYLTSIVEQFAHLREEPVELIAQHTTNNAIQLFQLKL